MYCTYGGYRHDDNSVTLASFLVRPRFSPRGRRISTIYEVHLNGELINNDPTLTTPALLQAAMATKISALINAYSENYKDFFFRHDDGTATRHSLISADSISGVHVTHRSWPNGSGEHGQYATLRDFEIYLTAEYLEEESELIAYNEWFHFHSTGGPMWKVDNTWDGPNYQLIYPTTFQTVIQKGSAIGLRGYPLIYINSFFPQWEHVDRRQVEVGTPRSYRNGWIYYPIEWTFHHSLPFGTSAVPIPR
jgi:hypothetical protein